MAPPLHSMPLGTIERPALTVEHMRHQTQVTRGYMTIELTYKGQIKLVLVTNYMFSSTTMERDQLLSGPTTQTS